MKVGDIEKAMKDAGVDSAVITAMKGLDTSAEVERLTGELTAEKGKSAQFLSDKKTEKTAKEAAEKALKEIEDAKLPADELAKKQADERQKQFDDLKQQLADKDTAFAAKEREASVAKIAGALKAASGIDASTINTLVKTRLTDIDLGDQSKVDEAIKNLTDTNKSLFAAEVPAGDGSQHQGGGGGDNGKPKTIADAMAAAYAK